MKLQHVHGKSLDLSERECLDHAERAVATYIARCIKDYKVCCPIGLFIWKVCEENGVDHHKIARHLGRRRRYEVKP